jgi:hypothetical protein
MNEPHPLGLHAGLLLREVDANDLAELIRAEDEIAAVGREERAVGAERGGIGVDLLRRDVATSASFSPPGLKNFCVSLSGLSRLAKASFIVQSRAWVLRSTRPSSNEV